MLTDVLRYQQGPEDDSGLFVDFGFLIAFVIPAKAGNHK
ncbi:hypothetical protein SPWS13_0804 [Shewanella putrefaciens]|nr:hypothetical protein SPWS13_0804 [Shewanella putrefaciens]